MNREKKVVCVVLEEYYEPLSYYDVDDWEAIGKIYENSNLINN